MFAEGKHDDAINAFLSLDTNPAKVIALYPDSVAGRLSTPKARWFELHGGPSPIGFVEALDPASPRQESDPPIEDNASVPSFSLTQSPTVQSLWRIGRGGAVPASVLKDDDAASITGRTKEKQESK